MLAEATARGLEIFRSVTVARVPALPVALADQHAILAQLRGRPRHPYTKSLHDAVPADHRHGAS